MDSLIILLLPVLIQVESGGNCKAIGDNGAAAGVLQIHKICVDDVNRISGKRYDYKDRFDAQKSRQMALIYLRHYGKAYERKTGQRANAEVLSRIWCGGPTGYRKKATLAYWKRVKKAGKK